MSQCPFKCQLSNQIRNLPKPPVFLCGTLAPPKSPTRNDARERQSPLVRLASKASFRVFVLFLLLAQIYPNSQVRTKKKTLVPWLYHHVSKKRYLVWGKSTSPMKVSRTLFFLGVKTKQLSLDKTGHTQEFKWWCCLKVYWMSSSKGRSFLACRLNYICVHHTICSKSTQTPWISLSFIPNIYIYMYIHDICFESTTNFRSTPHLGGENHHHVIQISGG